MSSTLLQAGPNMDVIKAKLKATWESGDFGQIAKCIEPAAEEFMAHVPLRPGFVVLDAACGTGNLAVIAAKRRCRVHGLDIAENLVEQAEARAKAEALAIEYAQGDAEDMPYEDASFDAVVSMYGVMFAPRPERIVAELRRVTKPGGLIALANWTPEGFIGKMFKVFARHLPASGLPSPLLWGDEGTLRERFSGTGDEIRTTRRVTHMRLPFDPAGTVDFFAKYYGPTNRAFGSLSAPAREALRVDLIRLQTEHNVSMSQNETDTPAEYLEVLIRRSVEP
jgi:SAM-dependent methyltransferase